VYMYDVEQEVICRGCGMR